MLGAVACEVTCSSLSLYQPDTSRRPLLNFVMPAFAQLAS